MKSYLPVFAALLFFSIPAWSQSFTFTADTVDLSGPAGSIFAMHGYVENTSSDSLDITVIRIVNTMPADWFSGMCNSSLCYSFEVDTFTVPDPLFGIPSMAPGEIMNFILDIYSMIGTNGVADVTIRVEDSNNTSDFAEITFTATASPTGIEDSREPLTGTYQLSQNYPNPFNPATRIPFEIGGQQVQDVSLRVYNMIGQQVATLVERRMAPGAYEYQWEGLNSQGQPLPSGVYFYELRAGDFRQMKKMFLLQ